MRATGRSGLRQLRQRAKVLGYCVFGWANGVGAAWLIVQKSHTAIDWLLAAAGIAVSVAMLRSHEYSRARESLKR